MGDGVFPVAACPLFSFSCNQLKMAARPKFRASVSYALLIPQKPYFIRFQRHAAIILSKASVFHNREV